MADRQFTIGVIKIHDIKLKHSIYGFFFRKNKPVPLLSPTNFRSLVAHHGIFESVNTQVSDLPDHVK